MAKYDDFLDNAAMESIFGALKSEFFYSNKFDSVERLEDSLRQYIRIRPANPILHLA